MAKIYWQELKGTTIIAKGYGEDIILSSNQQEISQEEYANLVIGRKPSDVDLRDLRIIEFRQKREELFKAFDIYKSNINYGIEAESEEEKSEIILWYKELCDFPTKITIDNYNTISYPQMPNSLKKYGKM